MGDDLWMFVLSSDCQRMDWNGGGNLTWFLLKINFRKDDMIFGSHWIATLDLNRFHYKPCTMGEANEINEIRK